MSNERKNTADFHPWDSVEGLGWSVSQQHKRVARQMGGFERNHLGRDRISLATDIHRRYNRNSSSVFSGTDFPLVNFYSQTLLQSHDGGRESLSEYTPLGMDPLHRMVDISPHKPHIGIRRGLMDVNMRRSAISLAANENSSALIYPSKPSGQSSIESAIAKFAPLEHDYPDSKTAPMADAVSGVPVISPKAEPSSEVIARREQISSEAAQPGNNRSQSSVQRAISRQNSVLSQNNYGSQDNNVFQGEPAQFGGNEHWTGHTAHFAAPLVTINRKFSLSSGNRFEGLGLGRKITDRTVGTLSQQGFAADFIPASAVAKFAPLEHNYPDS